jgi:hypothetical protein
MEPSITLAEAQEIVSEKTAPRVTEHDIKNKIEKSSYFVIGTTTICLITMRNGFVFIGHSTPASSANFDAAVGERYAYDNAFKQIWTHEGYLLKERMSQ